MPTLGAALDFAKLEARNLRAHQLGSAPGSPVAGQVYYDTGANVLYWYNGSSWVSAAGGAATDATTGSKGIVQLAGDLAGTAASPQIAAGVITDAEVNSANKDGSSGTASMRTLGTGAAQAMAGNTRLDTIAAPTGSVALNSQKITGLATPTAATDAATMGYVDTVGAGLDAKASVRCATTAAVTISTALNSGDVIDGITLANGDRVLVKDQAAPAQNGIYVVAASPARAIDMDAWAEVPSAYTWVETGTANADTGWVCTADQGGTLDTTAITWAQFTGLGDITAGAGLTKTGATLDAVGTTNRITVAADSIDISSSYVGQSTITTLGTVTTGVWNGTDVAVADGGTGQSTAKAARESGLNSCGYYSNAATHSSGTTITITQATHLLRSSRALLVQVSDNATGNVEIPDISVASNGDVTITYGASVSANSKLVTIVG